jgi:mevalonate pyrophosphate decarboxylase
MKDSISMNLDVLITRTTVGFQSSLAVDELIINGYYIRRVD